MFQRCSLFLPARQALNRIFIVSTVFVAVMASLIAFVLGMTSVRPVAGAANDVQTANSPAAVTVTHTNYLPLIFNQLPTIIPIITTFSAEPEIAAAGSGISLSWNILNTVDTLTMSPGVGDVTGLSTVVVTPTDSTTFTLLATNKEGSSSADVVVTVVQPPVISAFSVMTGTIDQGDSTTLNWTVENSVDALTIEPGIGDVSGLSSIDISPTETTTYTLTAVNIAGSVTADVVVTVIPAPAPIINSFTATATTIDQGDSTTLSWNIANNPTSVTISPGVGDVTGQSSVAVSPNSTTTYTITAVNSAGSDSEEITITVVEPPIINSFTASPGTINQGNSSTLSWSISNAVDSLTINQGVGDVTGQSSKSVSPSSTTTYMLTATNSAGSDTKQVTVTVNSGGTGAELLIFDWNKPVTTAERGFPWDKPPLENGNWVSPINYAGGTLQFRAEIFSQPVPQSGMKLQFCIWQSINSPNDRETCGKPENVPGTSGTVRTWSSDIPTMYKKDNLPIIWTQPRFKNGVAIKNSAGNPVSNYNGWDWYGEVPGNWYPLDMRFTVVVVEAGKTFSGWENYIP